MGGVWSTWKQYGRVAISLLARSSYSMVSHHMVFFLQQLVFYLDFIWVQVCIKQKKKRNNEKLDLIVVFNHRCDFFLNFCGKIYSNSDHAADPEKKKHRGENFKGKICLFTFGLKKKKNLFFLWGKTKHFLCLCMTTVPSEKGYCSLDFIRGRERKTELSKIHLCSFGADVHEWIWFYMVASDKRTRFKIRS